MLTTIEFYNTTYYGDEFDEDLTVKYLNKASNYIQSIINLDVSDIEEVDTQRTKKGLQMAICSLAEHYLNFGDSEGSFSQVSTVSFSISQKGNVLLPKKTVDYLNYGNLLTITAISRY